MNKKSTDDWEMSSQSFEQWLRHVADSEEVTEEELLDTMMSSYWILQELSSFMDGKSGGEHFDTNEGTDDSSHEPVSSSSPETPNQAEDQLDHIIELIEIMQSDASPDVTPPDSVQSTANADVERLQDRIDRLTQRIDRLVDERSGTQGRGGENDVVRSLPENVVTETELKRLSLEVEEVAETVAAIDADTDERIDHFAEQATELEAAVADLESRFESDLEQVTERFEQLSDKLADVESRHQSDFATVTDNFSHIEDVLKYLVERVDGFDSQIERLADQLTVIGGEDVEEKRLMEIKETANQSHIQTASCEDCGENVDISLLAEPKCPNCSRWFEELSDETSLFGLLGSNTLKTAPPGRKRTSSPVNQQPTAETTSPERSANPTASTDSRTEISLGDEDTPDDSVDDEEILEEFEWSNPLE